MSISLLLGVLLGLLMSATAPVFVRFVGTRYRESPRPPSTTFTELDLTPAITTFSGSVIPATTSSKLCSRGGTLLTTTISCPHCSTLLVANVSGVRNEDVNATS